MSVEHHKAHYFKELKEILQKYNKDNNQYEFVTNLKDDDLIRLSDSIKIKCNKHKTIQDRNIRSLIRKPPMFLCDQCKYEYEKQIKIERFNEIKEFCQEKGYFLLETEYIDTKTSIRYICLHHPDKIRTFKYNSMAKKYAGCRRCSGQNPPNKIPDEYYIEECERRGLEFIKTEYDNKKERRYLYCKCKIHQNEIIKISTIDFDKGGGHCKKCSSNFSKGETLIKKFLDDNNINYEVQKKFKDCVGLKRNYPLMFDFYLSDYNLCIEFQGQQHYIPQYYIYSFKDEEKGKKAFEENQIRDEIKRKYCKNNNIKLLEIKYNQKKGMYDILRKELNIKDELED